MISLTPNVRRFLGLDDLSTTQPADELPADGGMASSDWDAAQRPSTPTDWSQPVQPPAQSDTLAPIRQSAPDMQVLAEDSVSTAPGQVAAYPGEPDYAAPAAARPLADTPPNPYGAPRSPAAATSPGELPTPYGQVTSTTGEPDYVRPREWYEPTSTERRAWNAGVEQMQSGRQADGTRIGESVLPEWAAAGVTRVVGGANALNTASDAVYSRVDPVFQAGLAVDGIVESEYDPQTRARIRELQSQTAMGAMPQEVQDELDRLTAPARARYEQIKDNPDAVTRYANISPSKAAVSVALSLLGIPLGSAAGSGATATARGLGAGARTARAAGYAADVAAQGLTDPTNLVLQPGVDAAVRGVGATVRGARAAGRALEGAGDARLPQGQTSLGSGLVPEGGGNVLYHGSSRGPITAFETLRKPEGSPNPEGPGIFARPDLETAERYAGGYMTEGSDPHIIAIAKPDRPFIDFNEPLGDNLPAVQQAYIEAAQRKLSSFGASSVASKVRQWTPEMALSRGVVGDMEVAAVTPDALTSLGYAGYRRADNYAILDPALARVIDAIPLNQFQGDRQGLIERVAKAWGNESAAGSGLLPTRSDLRNAAQGGVIGAASEGVTDEELTPEQRLARIGMGAALGVTAGRAARRGAGAAGQRLGSGFVPDEPVRRAPRSPELLQQKIADTRRVLQDIDPRTEPELHAQVQDREARLMSELVDAQNAALDAQRAIDPALASDVGRRVNPLTLTEEGADAAMDARLARERVSPEDAANLGGPASVPTPYTPYRLNSAGGGAALGAGGGGLTGEEDGEFDPQRAVAGAVIGAIAGPGAGRAIPSLRTNAAKVAEAAKAGPQHGARMNRPIQVEGSKIPLSVRLANAITDDRAAMRWGENTLTDAAGQPRLPENSAQRPSTQSRVNPDTIADARIEDDLVRTVAEAEREGLADEVVQHVEDMHSFDVLVNVYQRTVAEAQAAGAPAARAQRDGDKAMRQWARESLNTTPEAIVERLEGQRQRLAQNGQADRVTELSERVWSHNRQTIQSLVDAGRMTAVDAQRLADEYPHYVPTQPLADLLPDGTGGMTAGTPGPGKVSAGSAPAVERFDDVGGQRGKRGERLNPIIASRNATIVRERQAQQNRVFNRFYEMVEAARTEGSDVTDASTGQRPNRLAGEVEVSGWVNGERQTIRVPKPIADMLDAAAQTGNPDAAMSFWGRVKQAVTETITSRRPAFFAVNLLRDFGDYAFKASAELGGPQTLPRVAGMYADELGKAIVDILGAASKTQAGVGGAVSGAAGFAMGPEDQTLEDRVKRGLAYGLAGAGAVGLAGKKIVPTGRSADFLARGGGMGRENPGWKAGERWYREAQRSGGMVARNPAELKRHVGDILRDLVLFEPMAQIGNRVELVPRTARMRLAEQAGEGATESMIRGRDATVDFSRGGEIAKSWNRLIPFFNVTVQGGAQLARTFRDHPAAAAASLATVMGPTMLATEVYNRSTPERARAYDDVPQYIKDTGIVLMMPWAGSDARGERPNYLWIPTGMTTPFVIASRAAMQNVPGLEPVQGTTMTDAAMSVLTMFSPVKGENLGSLAATVVPPIAKQGIELGMNKSTFTGNQIASDTSDERASAFGQAVAGGVNRVGQAVGSDSLQEVRPSQVDYLARQLPAYGDLILGVSNDMAPSAGRQAENRPIQNAPVVGQSAGRIIRDTGGANLERAQEAMLTPTIRRVLEEAKMRPSDASLAVPSRYRSARLTRSEQERWQTAFRAEVADALASVRDKRAWEDVSTREQAVREAISTARQRAARDALGLSEAEIKERIERETRQVAR